MTSATNSERATTAGSIRSNPLLEYFTRRSDAALVARIDDPSRRAIADALALGRQRGDAAETLWVNGHSAEALRLAGAALEATLGAVPTLARAIGFEPAREAAIAEIETVSTERAEGESTEDAAAPADETADEKISEAPPARPADERAVRAAVLRARGASADEIDALERASSMFVTAELPSLDAQCSPAHAELYQQLTHARQRLDRRLAPGGVDRRTIRVSRFARAATVLIVTVSVIAAAVLLTRKPEYTVRASAVWANAPAHDQDKALDGNPSTAWLVPDGEQGWLEVRFTSPHDLQHVRLLNTANAPFLDRATREYRVELYRADGQLAQTITGEFPFHNDPEWVEHAIDQDDISRIRFVVVSHHRASAGLAELAWD